MAEWLKAAVLKTVSGGTRSGVRIPLPPPSLFKKNRSGLAVQSEIFVLVLPQEGPVRAALKAADHLLLEQAMAQAPVHVLQSCPLDSVRQATAAENFSN